MVFSLTNTVRTQALIFIILASLGFNAESAFISHSRCYEQTVQAQGLNEVSLSHFLDCAAANPRLSYLGAQWIVLNKGHWEIRDNLRLSGRDYSIELKGIDNSRNIMDPSQKHVLELGLSNYSNSLSDIQRIAVWLESQVFPDILNGVDTPAASGQPFENPTAWSIDASFYHYLAYHDTPLYFGKRESGRNTYPGTLLASANFRSGWYEKNRTAPSNRGQNSAFSVLQTSVLGDEYWSELRRLYSNLREDRETRCLFRQERKAAQSFFTLLDHPQLVRAVHFTKLPGFGPQPSDRQFYLDAMTRTNDPDKKEALRQFANNTQLFSGAADTLPQRIGSLGPAALSTTSGDLRWDWSFVGARGEDLGIDYTDFGVHGLIGRPLYIEAFNKSIRRAGKGEAQYFQGQNAIVRNITAAAVSDLRAMKGLGSNESQIIRQNDGYFINPGAAPAVFGDARNAKGNITPNYNPRPGIYLDYQQTIQQADQLIVSGIFKHQGTETASHWVADYGRNKSSNHPAMTRPYFTQTEVSFGWSLSSWIKYLNSQNIQPQLRYYLIGYDYGIRPRLVHRNTPVIFRSYYERLVEVVDPNKGRELFDQFTF